MFLFEFLLQEDHYIVLVGMLCLVSSFRELSYCLGILCLFINLCSLLIPVMTCSEKELNILKFLTYSNYIFQKVSINDFPHFLRVQVS